MSIAQRAGLPEAVQTALLLLSIALALTPYLTEVSIGILKIPKLSMRERRSMKIIGPIAVVLAIALVAPLSALAPASKLRLLAADVDEAGQIDVVVANNGTTAALLTKIELELLRDRQLRARPTLMPTAAYRIPIDRLSVGGRRSLLVRQLVLPSTAERIVIAPMTNRALEVRLRMHTADGEVLTADVSLWPSTAGRADRR